MVGAVAVPIKTLPALVMRIRSVVFAWKIVSRTELIIPFVPSVTKLVIVAPSDERASWRCPFVPVVPDFMAPVLLNVPVTARPVELSAITSPVAPVVEYAAAERYHLSVLLLL